MHHGKGKKQQSRHGRAEKRAPTDLTSREPVAKDRGVTLALALLLDLLTVQVAAASAKLALALPLDLPEVVVATACAALALAKLVDLLEVLSSRACVFIALAPLLGPRCARACPSA